MVFLFVLFLMMSDTLFKEKPVGAKASKSLGNTELILAMSNTCMCLNPFKGYFLPKIISL